MSLHLSIAPEVMFRVWGIPITDTIVFSWVVMVVILIGAIILRIAIFKAYKVNQDIPVGVSNVGELIVEGINGFTKGNLHHHWKPFAPYIGTIGVFLAIANTLGMFGFGLKPPTRDFHLTLALASITIMLVVASSIRFRGVLGFIKSFFEPLWWMFPLKVIEYFSRLISLTARLFGNILAAFIIMEMLIQVSHAIVLKFSFGVSAVIILCTYLIALALIQWGNIPKKYKIWLTILIIVTGAGTPALFSFYFDIFDGLLQAFVFVFLSTLYIEEAYE